MSKQIMKEERFFKNAKLPIPQWKPPIERHESDGFISVDVLEYAHDRDAEFRESFCVAGVF